MTHAIRRDRPRLPPWIWPVAALLLLVVTLGLIALWVGAPALYERSGATADARATATATTRSGILTIAAAAVAALSAAAVLTETRRSNRAKHELDREAQLNDRYTRAIDQLADEDDAKVDRRLGGIHALRRIAEDSRRDQPSIVEVLCAFIRRRGRSPSLAGAEPVEEHRQPLDVQMALSAIGRLPRLGQDDERIDLSGAHVENAELDGLNFSHADLSEADFSYARMDAVDISYATGFEVNLSHAILRRANLENAQLKGSRLVHANLIHANLTGARLSFAHLGHANLRGAQLRNTDLRSANLTGAYFSAGLRPPESGPLWERVEATTLRGAVLEGAFLTGAHLAGVDLTDVDLGKAWMSDTDLRGADLSLAVGVSQRQLDEAFGDATTRLPQGLERPDSWTSPQT